VRTARDDDEHGPALGGAAPTGTLDARARRRESWRAGLAVVGVVVVTGAVALAAVAWLRAGQNAAPLPPPIRRVDVVGDSLVHQASGPLRAGLHDAGFESSVVGLPSQSLSSGGIKASLDEAAAGRDEVLVVATTTNDVRDNAVIDGARANAPAYREEITALLDRFGDRCVVIVNARDRTNPIFLPERADILNSELVRLERENDNLVVVDWAARSRDMPTDWFSSDQLHFGGKAEDEAPNSPSSQAYAAAIVDGVRRCDGRLHHDS
jgi:hypothetical protein